MGGKASKPEAASNDNSIPNHREHQNFAKTHDETRIPPTLGEVENEKESPRSAVSSKSASTIGSPEALSNCVIS